MFKNQQKKTLGQMLDGDKGFIASRRLLMTLSILLLVSVFGGVSIKEANTFIFKIEFLNPKALNALLVVSVVTCFVRYYAFSMPYHKRIQEIWGDKLMGDSSVFYVNNYDDEIGGLLSRKLQYLPSERHGIDEAKYEPRLFFRRDVTFEVHERFVDEYEQENEHKYTEIEHLHKFDAKWKFKCFLIVLGKEVKYRFITILQNREYLDVLFPYWVAIAAVLSYVLGTFFPAELASILQGNLQQLWLPHSI